MPVLLASIIDDPLEDLQHLRRFFAPGAGSAAGATGSLGHPLAVDGAGTSGERARCPCPIDGAFDFLRCRLNLGCPLAAGTSLPVALPRDRTLRLRILPRSRPAIAVAGRGWWTYFAQEDGSLKLLRQNGNPVRIYEDLSSLAELSCEHRRACGCPVPARRLAAA